jgi:hypothetical protein
VRRKGHKQVEQLWEQVDLRETLENTGGEGVTVHPSTVVANFATVNDGRFSPAMEEKMALVDVEEPSELGSSPAEIFKELTLSAGDSSGQSHLNGCASLGENLVGEETGDEVVLVSEHETDHRTARDAGEFAPQGQLLQDSLKDGIGGMSLFTSWLTAEMSELNCGCELCSILGAGMHMSFAKVQFARLPFF